MMNEGIHPVPAVLNPLIYGVVWVCGCAKELVGAGGDTSEYMEGASAFCMHRCIWSMYKPNSKRYRVKQ